MRKYFISLNGFTYGPYSFEDLRAMNLHPSTPVWFQGMGGWIPANQVGELQSLFYYSQPSYYQPSSGYVPPDYGMDQNNTQPTSTPKRNPDNSNKTLAIILISVFVVLIGLGIFLFYSYEQKKEREREAMNEIMDSVTVDPMQQQMQSLSDSLTLVLDSMAAANTDLGTSQYSGNYTNSGGGTIQVKGNNNYDLQITLKFQSSTDYTCSGEVSGTGTASGTDKIIMITNSGNRIVLTFTGTIVDVEESSGSKSSHGSCFSYDGFYFRQ
jgi:hypothetical protein